MDISLNHTGPYIFVSNTIINIGVPFCAINTEIGKKRKEKKTDAIIFLDIHTLDTITT